MALGDTCSRSQVGVFSSKSRQIWTYFQIFFTSSGTLRWRGSGDLHIPELEVLNKSLIKKKTPGTRSVLKNAASPCGEREFISRRWRSLIPFAAIVFRTDRPFLRFSAVVSACFLQVSILTKWNPRYSSFDHSSMQCDCWHCFA